MDARRAQRIGLGGLAVLLVLGTAGPGIASPPPISACPPCSTGFTRAAEAHGLDTEVRHSEATVRAYRNGSATWTVQVVPTNESVLDRLADDRSLARAVADDSFGTRYGNSIGHDLHSATVADGEFVLRYRTEGVVDSGPFGTRLMTYFRDSPGPYVYTDLGADELTLVPPRGMTVALGFGTVTGDRMTATRLPDVRDGPFVVFVPEGSPTPGLLGTFAVGSALWDVVARNLVYFVAIPWGVLVGGFAGIRRFFPAETARDPTHLGSIVAATGTVLLVASVLQQSDVFPVVLGMPILVVGGGVGGAALLALGAAVATPGVRRHLTGTRVVGAGIVLGIAVAIVSGGLSGVSPFQLTLLLAVAVLPGAVGLGWIDAQDTAGNSSRSTRLSIGLSMAILGVFVLAAPLRALGGGLFFLVPILLTVAAAGIVIVAIPLYVLGAAGGNAELTRS